MAYLTTCCLLRDIFFKWVVLVCSFFEKHELQDKPDRFIANGNKSQLRSDLINCLSSDSIRSHPEIPHESHLLSIWPCSHAIQYCTAARSVLQIRQGFALKHCNEENKLGWGRNKRHRHKMQCNGIYGEKGWEMTLTPPLVIDLNWICPACALLKHECVHDDFFQMMVYMMISHCQLITWLTGRAGLFWPELTSNPVFSVSSFLCPGCVSPLIYIPPRLISASQHPNVQEHSISRVECTLGLRCPSLRLQMRITEFRYQQLKVCMCYPQHIAPYLCQNGNRSLSLPVKPH